jgi:hypothetical protein
MQHVVNEVFSRILIDKALEFMHKDFPRRYDKLRKTQAKR